MFVGGADVVFSSQGNCRVILLPDDGYPGLDRGTGGAGSCKAVPFWEYVCGGILSGTMLIVGDQSKPTLRCSLGQRNKMYGKECATENLREHCSCRAIVTCSFLISLMVCLFNYALLWTVGCQKHAKGGITPEPSLMDHPDV